MYTYQRPDYTQMVKPLANYLLPLLRAVKPSEALAAYSNAHKALSKLSHQKQEAAMRNFFTQILADELSRDFDKETDTSALPLFAAFQLVDDFRLVELFDVILETLKQNPDFFGFYYRGFEDAAILMLAHVGEEHLEELKETIKTEGFVSEVYLTIFNAVVQMAVENPSRRLQVLAWASDVIKSCTDKTIPATTMDLVMSPLARIKAVELLPLIKDIYKTYDVPALKIKGGIKGVTKLLTNGTKEPIVDFTDFKSLLIRLTKVEDNDFEAGDDEDDFSDDWLDEDWDDEEDEPDIEDLFYKRSGPKAAKPKPKSTKKGEQRYALTLDITLKGSPRKVYRQLVVPSDLTLDHLGEILIDAVGWDGYHPNQFIDGTTFYSVSHEESWMILDAEDACAYTIGDLLGGVNSKIKWEYDFGDSWVHEIVLAEKSAVGKKEKVKIQLLKGSGACPPEDCGGVYGYRHLLNVLKNPNDEEYEDTVKWLGGDFDPKDFSLSDARERVEDCTRELKL